MGEVLYFPSFCALSRSIVLLITVSSLLSLAMVLLAKFGKALFALFFIISAWEQLCEFGTDGGPAARFVGPKVDLITDRASSTLGVQLPRIEIKGLIAIGIALKGIGGILFAFGSSTDAYLLLLHKGISAPFLHYFDDYDDPDSLQGITLDLAIYGMLFYFVGMDRTILMRAADEEEVR